MAIFNPANLDFIQVSSLGCVTETDFYKKLLVVIIVPIILLAAIVVLYFIPKTIKTQDVRERKKVRRNTWKLIFFSLFLVYPTVSQTILRLYVCKQVGPLWYLLADFRTHCYTQKWHAWAGVVGLLIVIYPIGIPAFFFAMLWRYRKRLGEAGIRDQLGFIYDAYNRETWWFEMCDMAHKLFVTAMVAFLPFEAQMPTAMCIVWLYSSIILVTQPYLRKGDDRLHMLAQTELGLVLLSGHTLNTLFGTYDPIMDVVMSIFLIAIVVLFFLIFLAGTARVLKKLFDTFKKPKTVRKADADDKKKRKAKFASIMDLSDIAKREATGANTVIPKTYPGRITAQESLEIQARLAGQRDGLQKEYAAASSTGTTDASMVNPANMRGGSTALPAPLDGNAPNPLMSALPDFEMATNPMHKANQ
jgi:flagellar basal body-associated protein FliL